MRAILWLLLFAWLISNIYGETESMSWKLKEERKDQYVHETLTPFVHVLQGLIRCTDVYHLVLSDSLERLTGCTNHTWQRCFNVRIHEMFSHQMVLDNHFPCHMGRFDVSHIQSLQYNIRTLILSGKKDGTVFTTLYSYNVNINSI